MEDNILKFDSQCIHLQFQKVNYDINIVCIMFQMELTDYVDTIKREAIPNFGRLSSLCPYQHAYRVFSSNSSRNFFSTLQASSPYLKKQEIMQH